MTVIGWVILLYLVLIIVTLWAVNKTVGEEEKDEWIDGTKKGDDE